MKLPPWIENLPAWLKIVSLLVIVLGILACGVGAGRALTESPNSQSTAPQPTPNIVSAVPAAEIKMSGSCTPSTLSNGQHQFTGTFCVFSVTPSGLFPRELRLRLQSGSGTMTVEQEIRGRPQQSTKSVSSQVTLTAPVAGSSDVRVSITCVLACTLVVADR